MVEAANNQKVQNHTPYEEIFHEGPLALLTKAAKTNC